MRKLGLLRRATTVAILIVASGAQAFDLSIPLPKPNLPAIPVPSFLTGSRKELSEEEIEEVRKKSDRDRDVVKLAVDDANPPLTNGIDLSPSYSDRLPYGAVLGRVVCESNAPLDSLDGLQAEIVQLQRDLIDYLQIPEADEKIELCVFKDRASYRDFIANVFPGAPTDRPALYVKRGSEPGVLMVQNDSNMIVNTRHEMTHAYLNATLRHVPIWLDEGLAKYFETPPGERGFRNPYLGDVEDQATGLFSSPPSLTRLEKLARVDQMRSREYRESWAWVHFMLHYSPTTHRVLVNYLRTLRRENQRGVSAEEAYKIQKKSPVKRELAAAFPDYEKRYLEHFRNWDKRRASYERGRSEGGLRHGE